MSTRLALCEPLAREVVCDTTVSQSNQWNRENCRMGQALLTPKFAVGTSVYEVIGNAVVTGMH